MTNERRVNNNVNRVEVKAVTVRNFYATGTATRTVGKGEKKTKQSYSILVKFDKMTRLEAKTAAKAWAKANKVKLDGVYAAG